MRMTALTFGQHKVNATLLSPEVQTDTSSFPCLPSKVISALRIIS